MEKLPPTAERGTGSYADLIELMVEEGIPGLRAHENLREECVEGGTEGFEQCRGMKDLGVMDFELALIGMETEDKANRLKLYDGLISREDYWRHRYSTLQVEHCYEVLRVAYKAEHEELPDDQRGDFSARAAVRYNVLAFKLNLNYYGLDLPD